MVPTLAIFLIEKIKISEIKKEFINGNKKAIIITSVSWSLSIIGALRAYQLGKVTTVAPLCALTVILNVIAGYIFLKERNDVIKKIIAAIVIVASIILIRI